MVRVTIELIPQGDESKARTIGVINIANDGTGNDHFGNYTVEAAHAGKYYEARKTKVFKRGRVTRFMRTLSPYRLVYRALHSIGEM